MWFARLVKAATRMLTKALPLTVTTVYTVGATGFNTFLDVQLASLKIVSPVPTQTSKETFSGCSFRSKLQLGRTFISHKSVKKKISHK
jgi:hypothetical protein